jgi:hypothetical protein
MKRSHTPEVVFSVQHARDGSTVVHSNTCPLLPSAVLPEGCDEHGIHIAVVNGDIWYCSFARLTDAIASAEQVVAPDLRCKIRHCRTCGWNGRLIRLDDRLAKPFACDAPDTVTSAIPNGVTAKQIVCLECGKSRKRFRTHLRKTHRMTPEQYREKWKLPANFPMVPQRIHWQMA